MDRKRLFAIIFVVVVGIGSIWMKVGESSAKQTTCSQFAAMGTSATYNNGQPSDKQKSVMDKLLHANKKSTSASNEQLAMMKLTVYCGIYENTASLHVNESINPVFVNG